MCARRGAVHGRPVSGFEFVLFICREGRIIAPDQRLNHAVSVWNSPSAALATWTARVQIPFTNCAAMANIITATVKSSSRQVAGRASQGASQAAPSARAKNQISEALAAPRA